MNGRPVWLASISRKSPISGGRLSTQVWSEQTMRDSIALLRRCVGPDGDPSRERVFRMQVTTCLHRAASDADLKLVPDWFHAAGPTDLAGGPVEILEETEEGSLSTRPCHDPVHIPLDRRNPLLWFPGECKKCPPCRARAKLDRRQDEAGVAPLTMADLAATDGGPR